MLKFFNLHIRVLKRVGLAVILAGLLLLPGISKGQTTINFNSGYTTDCWLYNNSSIGYGVPFLYPPINSGSDAYQLQSYCPYDGNNSTFYSPYINFTGSDVVTFKHKLMNSNLGYGDAQLNLYILDTNNNQVWNGFSWSGTSTSTVTESININYTGKGRLVWEWSNLNPVYTYFLFGYIFNLAVNNGFTDDISITANTISPYYVTDTVCEGDKNVEYKPSYTVASNSDAYTYSWSFASGAGGTLTPLATDSKAHVTWDLGPGDNQLVCEEDYNGVCTGRSTIYNIHVIALPAVDATIDSVCEGESPVVQLDFVGTAPWQMTYSIDSGPTQTFTTSSASEIIALTKDASNFEILSLQDGGPCGGNVTVLPNLNIYYHPTPNTGPIYHQP